MQTVWQNYSFQKEKLEKHYENVLHALDLGSLSDVSARGVLLCSKCLYNK